MANWHQWPWWSVLCLFPSPPIFFPCNFFPFSDRDKSSNCVDMRPPLTLIAHLHVMMDAYQQQLNLTHLGWNLNLFWEWPNAALSKASFGLRKREWKREENKKESYFPFFGWGEKFEEKESRRKKNEGSKFSLFFLSPNLEKIRDIVTCCYYHTESW